MSRLSTSNILLATKIDKAFD